MEKESLRDTFTDVMAGVISWFINAAFLMWGWTVLAPHLNAPIFSYWEIFAIRMAIGSVVKMFKN